MFQPLPSFPNANHVFSTSFECILQLRQEHEATKEEIQNGEAIEKHIFVFALSTCMKSEANEKYSALTSTHILMKKPLTCTLAS